jgi:hypothetical protein
METLDIMKKLAEPYPGYSPEGQIVWLKKKGFSVQVIDAAMTDIYFEISKGKTFETGALMDARLLEIAQGYEKQEATAMISSANTLKKQIEGGKLQKLWWVIKGEL